MAGKEAGKIHSLKEFAVISAAMTTLLVAAGFSIWEISATDANRANAVKMATGILKDQKSLFEPTPLLGISYSGDEKNRQVTLSVSMARKDGSTHSVKVIFPENKLNKNTAKDPNAPSTVLFEPINFVQRDKIVPPTFIIYDNDKSSELRPEGKVTVSFSPKDSAKLGK